MKHTKSNWSEESRLEKHTVDVLIKLINKIIIIFCGRLTFMVFLPCFISMKINKFLRCLSICYCVFQTDSGYNLFWGLPFVRTGLPDSSVGKCNGISTGRLNFFWLKWQLMCFIQFQSSEPVLVNIVVIVPR